MKLRNSRLPCFRLMKKMKWRDWSHFSELGLFFRRIKIHLWIKAFYRTSLNALQKQSWPL